MYLKLSEFYDGKSILLTGAAGFLGTMILEILLRCFPGIKCIYILLREKKGIEPLSRKSIIFNKRIFRNWEKTHPDLVEKVHVVPGDVCLPDLGINEEDLSNIIEDVTIVFHLAAIISFKKSIRFTALANAKGTLNVAELCRKLKKLDVFVYTSTAYSNCYIQPNKIEEKVYKLPYPAQRFLDELESGDDASFAELVLGLKYKWPNPYAFSKCLAELFLLEKASDIPMVIIRPSIVGASLKGPTAGYAEEGSGLLTLMLGGGTGFIKVIRANSTIIFDVIPADIVANAHIIAACVLSKNRSSVPFVVNCTAGDVLNVTFPLLKKVMMKLSKEYPVPKGFQLPSIKIVNSKFLYTLYSLYEHYLPAVFFDVALRINGSKFRLKKMYQFYDCVMKELYYFMSTSFDFETVNFKGLSQYVSPEEKEIIYTDMKGLTITDWIQTLPNGSDVYDWKFDRYSKSERKNIVLKRTMFATLIKRTTLFTLCFLLYFVISKLFFN